VPSSLRFYVDADTGRLIAARLRDRLAAGRLRPDRDDVRALPTALTSDLRKVNGDLHLSVPVRNRMRLLTRPGSRGLTTPKPRRPDAPPDPDEPELTPALLAEWRQGQFRARAG
jgi:hypothetical protein